MCSCRTGLPSPASSHAVIQLPKEIVTSLLQALVTVSSTYHTGYSLYCCKPWSQYHPLTSQDIHFTAASPGHNIIHLQNIHFITANPVHNIICLPHRRFILLLQALVTLSSTYLAGYSLYCCMLWLHQSSN